MKLLLTSDANSESGVGEVVDEIAGITERFFMPKNYGIGLSGLGIVLMCRDPRFLFKRRVRFARKEKMIYMDVMLDLNQMRGLKHEQRKQVVFEKIGREIPEVVKKYSIRDFDEAGLVKDLNSWLAASHKTPTDRA